MPNETITPAEVAGLVSRLTTMAEVAGLVSRLTTMADMIQLVERIAWGVGSGIMRESTAALEALSAELTTERAAHAETRRERDELKADINSYAEASSNLATELFKAEAQRDEALKALEPFAEASAYHMAFDDERPVRADGDVLVKHLRAARRALEGGE